MNGSGILEKELAGFALALVLISLGGFIARFLRFPFLLGYLFVGLLAQPLLRPFPSLILLSSVGVILLLFFLGMEFDWRRLLTAPQRLLITVVDFGFNFLLPFLVLLLFGLPLPVSFIIAMAIYPTSSAITISALLQLKRLANPETETIVWILVGEDLAIIALLAIASGLTGSEFNLTNMATAFAFVALMLVASVLLTRPLEFLFERIPAELDNIVTMSVIVLISAVAHFLHLSEALGAFLAGLLFSGTRDREELEQRLHILRELGTAAFFFTFGLQSPLKISFASAIYSLLVLAFASLTKTVTAWFAAIIDNLRRRSKIRLLLSLWVRGEFSIIAIFMGKNVLPPFWQEVVSWFVIGSIVLGLIAISLAGKIAERT
ncbi:MAG: cation:proton antiporter [Armatimonadetes bacterium]|nr:cation:proton antiporter [Armatimonadota bacterium]MDW8028175.1 cation:proton antiporter [Armatimonadota bacterium]